MNYPPILKLLNKGYGKYKTQLAVLALLGLLSGLLEGIGITALIPLFSLLTEGAGATDVISKSIETFFGWLNLGLGLKALLSFIILAFIFKAIVMLISHYISTRLSADYERETRSFLLRETLRSRWDFLLGQKLGHLETILIKDVDMARALFLHLGTAVIGIATLAVYVVIAFSISPIVTLFSLVLGGVIFLVLKPIIYMIRELSRKVAYTNSDMIRHVNENIMGLKTVKASSAEGYVSRKAEGYFNLLRDANIKVSLLGMTSSVLIEPVSIIFVSGAFAFSYLSGNFQVGIFAATMYLIQRVFKQIQVIQTIVYAINERIPYLQRVVDFQDEVVSHKEVYGGLSPFVFNDRLEFSNINFSYSDKGKSILSRFTLGVKKGEMIGIVGESGAGKTTIVDLLLRLFTPTSGSIFIDGVNIDRISIEEWRKNIGYVPQDIFIISDTIENNIRFYDEKITDKDVVRGAKMAYIYDFIQSQPQKFKTSVGERGAMLSGGEKQRLVLARYLARNPQILILDEATSALDNKSEAIIQKAIDGLKGKITILVIAHRLPTILNCDKIIFLGKGKIREEGSPSDLLGNKNSYLYKLYNQ